MRPKRRAARRAASPTTESVQAKAREIVRRANSMTDNVSIASQRWPWW